MRPSSEWAPAARPAQKPRRQPSSPHGRGGAERRETAFPRKAAARSGPGVRTARRPSLPFRLTSASVSPGLCPALSTQGGSPASPAPCFSISCSSFSSSLGLQRPFLTLKCSLRMYLGDKNMHVWGQDGRPRCQVGHRPEPVPEPQGTGCQRETPPTWPCLHAHGVPRRGFLELTQASPRW